MFDIRWQRLLQWSGRRDKKNTVLEVLFESQIAVYRIYLNVWCHSVYQQEIIGSWFPSHNFIFWCKETVLLFQQCRFLALRFTVHRSGYLKGWLDRYTKRNFYIMCTVNTTSGSGWISLLSSFCRKDSLLKLLSVINISIISIWTFHSYRETIQWVLQMQHI